MSISSKILRIEMRDLPRRSRRDKLWEAVVLLAISEEVSRGHLSRAGGGQRTNKTQVRARRQDRPRPRRAPPPETIQGMDLSRIQASRRS